MFSRGEPKINKKYDHSMANIQKAPIPVKYPSPERYEETQIIKTRGLVEHEVDKKPVSLDFQQKYTEIYGSYEPEDISAI